MVITDDNGCPSSVATTVFRAGRTAQNGGRTPSGMLSSDSVRAASKLLAREDQPLLVWRKSFLALDLDLGVVDGV